LFSHLPVYADLITRIHWAAKANALKCLEFLLSVGVSPNRTTGWEEDPQNMRGGDMATAITPLMAAAEKGCLEVFLG